LGLNEYTNNIPLKAVTLPDDPAKIMWLYRRNRIVRCRIMANTFHLENTAGNFIDGAPLPLWQQLFRPFLFCSTDQLFYFLLLC